MSSTTTVTVSMLGRSNVGDKGTMMMVSSLMKKVRWQAQGR
jgi:hypothetical protein